MAPTELLPVTVLSGFLGAGKTTLLKHVLRLAGDPQAGETAKAGGPWPLKVAVLVNDMGEVNLDASEIKSSRLIQEEATMVEMHNGCICCTLRGDLLKTVKALSEEQAFDYLVIESTGISEPLPVAQTFTMDVDGASHNGPQEGFRSLSHFAKLDTLVTVVDALNIYDILGSLETLAERNMTSMVGNTGAERGEDENVDDRSIAQLMLEQIEFANVILLSKAHLLPSPARVSEIRALLQRLNPGARVLLPEEPHFADVPLSAVINTGLFDMEAAQKTTLWAAELAKEEGHVPETLEYGISSIVFRRHDRPFHHERVKEVLKSLGNYGSAAAKEAFAALQGVVRAKGQLWVVPCEYAINIHIAGRHCEVHTSSTVYLAAAPEDLWNDEGRRKHKELLAEGRWHAEAFGDRESEAIFIGVDLDRSHIVRALEGALLTDEELAVWKEEARARAERGEVRVAATVSSLTEVDRLLAICRESGEAGNEFVSIPGYESMFTRRQLREYVHGLKVMDEFPVPGDIPFHVFIAKSAGGKACVLQDVRKSTGASVRVVKEESKIVFGGLFSKVVNAKRELQAFLDSFVARTLRLEQPQVEHVSNLGKTGFPKMENFRHLTTAKMNREQRVLVLSGAPDAVAEAQALVEELFREQGWPQPQAEP